MKKTRQRSVERRILRDLWFAEVSSTEGLLEEMLLDRECGDAMESLEVLKTSGSSSTGGQGEDGDKDVNVLPICGGCNKLSREQDAVNAVEVRPSVGRSGQNCGNPS